jgi:hypothetical protein
MFFICLGRYKVDDVIQEEREDCYLATLHIKDASATDSRAYYLAVENDRGTDRHAVQLFVNGESSDVRLKITISFYRFLL